LNDGIGNPKNVKSLLLSHKTPPAMSLGVRSCAEEAVRAGFRYIQFAEVPETISIKVDAYLQSMKPLESPFKQVAEDLAEGEALYQSLNCQECHPPPLYTNLGSYSLGGDKELHWDTPTLIELWRTGPYWHDGRFATLKEVLETEQHGLHGPLSVSDLKKLEAYLMSL
jgi:mono/diheme cytochrome c family protein